MSAEWLQEGKQMGTESLSFVDPLPFQNVGSALLGRWAEADSLSVLSLKCFYKCDKDLDDLASVEREELYALKRHLIEQSEDWDVDVPVVSVNLKRVLRRKHRWESLFPDITPYYAVKCNPDPAVVKTLALVGVNFDCASIQEIALVLSADVAPSRIVYANPCKAEHAILYARSCGVTRMTFDNVEELDKIANLFPIGSELILRIATDDTDASTVNLSTKFGADVENVSNLLAEAQRRKLAVIGISFHVGSGCHTAEAYEKALSTVADILTANPDFNCRLVDIGGGYPGKQDLHDESLLEDIAVRVANVIEERFSRNRAIEFIAEPGRFFVQSSHLLGTAIVKKQQEPGLCYTISEGVYGYFKDRVLVDECFPPQVLLKHSEDPEALCSATVMGPSGHKLDVVCPVLDCGFSNLSVGDWLAFRDMGAYTSSLSSCHYHYKLPNRVYTWI